MGSLALKQCCAFALRLLQGPDAGWQLSKEWVEPILAVKLYVLLVLVSIAVAALQILRNWILLPPFKSVPAEVGQRAGAVFRRQTLSLQRWMILNVLAWAAVTVAGLIELFRGVWVSRTAGLQVIAPGLEEVLWPSGLFFLNFDNSSTSCALAYSLAGRASRALRVRSRNLTGIPDTIEKREDERNADLRICLRRLR